MTTHLNQAEADEVWLVIKPERMFFHGTLLSTEKYSPFFDGTTCVSVYRGGDGFYIGVGWTSPIEDDEAWHCDLGEVVSFVSRNCRTLDEVAVELAAWLSKVEAPQSLAHVVTRRAMMRVS